MFYFVGSETATGSLASVAFQRLWSGFRPATLTAYTRIFNTFLGYLVVLNLSLSLISTIDILAFMEYLTQSGMSPDHIVNHLTAIRSLCIIYNCDTTPFGDQRLLFFIKSLKINRQFNPGLKLFINENTLLNIVAAASQLESPEAFQPLYLLCYFSFLRLSNILLHATAGFDVTRHLCVGDVIFSSTGATIVVKWSKTIQDRISTATVVIPYLVKSPLCPVSAIRTMLAKAQSNTDEPLFQIHAGERYKVLTDSVARKHLKRVSVTLGLPRSLTFHDFRRGGTTWAFLKGVSIQQI